MKILEPILMCTLCKLACAERIHRDKGLWLVLVKRKNQYMQNKTKPLARFPKNLGRASLVQIENALGRALTAAERKLVLESYRHSLANHKVDNPAIDVELAIPKIRNRQGAMLCLSGRLHAVDRYSKEYSDSEVEWRVILTVACAPVE